MNKRKDELEKAVIEIDNEKLFGMYNIDV